MGKRRRDDPTMKTVPQDGGTKGGEEGTSLEEKYKKLELHWDSCKQSNPPPPHNVLRRCSTGSSSISVDQLFNKYSPRELMSSLQLKHRRSPTSEGGGYMMMFNSKVRENDDMLVELLRDRLSAIQSGKLKGRRLFQDSDDDDEELDGEEICSDCGFDLMINQRSEQVKSVVSSYASDEIINDGCTSGGISKEDDDELCSPSNSTTTSTTSSSSLISNGKLVEREKVVVAMERENNITSVAGEKINIGKGERVNIMPAAMAWFGIIVFLMLFVIWMSCNGWYVGEDDVEVLVVPT